MWPYRVRVARTFVNGKTTEYRTHRVRANSADEAASKALRAPAPGLYLGTVEWIRRDPPISMRYHTYV